MNLFMNQIRPRIDTTAWTLDTSGGSRHKDQHRLVSFNSPVMAVLAWQGGREDLAPLVSSQLAMIDQNFRYALTVTDLGMYYNLGSEPTSLFLVATQSASDRARLLPLLSDAVDSLSSRSGPSDPRYFSGGVWLSGQDDCFRCNIGPGVAAAAVAASTGDRLAFGLAVLTFDHAIAAHRQADGSFGPPSGGETGDDIQTMMFANELGTALIALTPQLDPGRIQAWTSALTDAADFLIRNGNLSWYTNGNIVLGNTLTMALAYRVTGNATYSNFDRCVGLRLNGTAGVTGTLNGTTNVDVFSLTPTGFTYTRTGNGDVFRASGTLALRWKPSVQGSAGYFMTIDATVSDSNQSALFRLDNFQIDSDLAAGVENVLISGRLTTVDGFVDISSGSRLDLPSPSSGLGPGSLTMVGATQIATVNYAGNGISTVTIAPKP